MPEGINLFQDTLIKSLKFGFVDNIKYQEGGYSPQILVNNSDEKRYVLTDLQEELSKCTAFYFSVAFVTKNGIAMIKSQLSDLMDKKVPGKILISPYLDFNDPDAMRELLKLKNVEVRLTPEKMQMHAKFYLFEHTGKQVLISGSSNLTHTALKIKGTIYQFTPPTTYCIYENIKKDDFRFGSRLFNFNSCSLLKSCAFYIIVGNFQGQFFHLKTTV